MDAKGGIVKGGDILISNRKAGENDLDGNIGRESREGLEARESAAGSNPDSAVRLLGESVGVAIVPDQAVVHVVVCPAGAVPNIDAVLSACPQASLGVEFEKINQAVGAGSLDIFFNHHTASPGMDAVNAASEVDSRPR